jgi:ABC-2 type transport system permease protein
MRFVDLTLARPLTRVNVIVRSLLVLAAAIVVVLALMLMGTWIGLTCCTPADAPRPGFSLLRSLAISLAAVMTCWGGVALALASAVRRRATAGATTGILALASYLLDYLGRAWEPASGISVLSPFHYFEPNGLVAGQMLNVTDLLVLATIGIGGIVIGLAVFSRRDI